MTDQEFHDILKRYIKGKTSPSEEKLVEEFYKRNTEKSIYDDYSEEEADRVKNILQRKVLSSIHELEKPKQSTHYLLKIAASVVLVLGITIALYLSLSETPEPTYLTKSIARGQKATITLSDGSVVKLNSESSITYPESFADVATRDIQLTGEAFFEVKRDEAKPFTIQTEGLLTTVLGTSFNITAFQEMDEIEVTVATGKVRVVSNSPFEPGRRFERCDGCGQEVDFLSETLTPGQQATYNKTSNELSIREVDTERSLAWKDGVIYMANEKYKQVFDKLSRWYGLEFEYVNVPTDEWDYSGEFKDMSLELVLSTIGYSKGFDFQIQENVVILKFEN